MKGFTVPAIFKAMDQFSGPVSKMQRTNAAFATSLQATAARGHRAFRKIHQGASRVLNKLINIRSAAGALIAGAAIKKMYDMVTAQAKLGDEAAKTSKRLGITAEALQEFQFAADRSGVAPAALSKSFEKMNKNVGDLQQGTGSLHTILKRNNPALHEQLKAVKNNEQAFTLISEAIRKAPNELQRMSLAQAAFGRSGGEMINLLMEGKAGIAALREEARKYGGVMSNEAAAAAEKFVDAQTNMQFALRGLKMIVAVELMPQLQELIEKVTAWTVKNKDLIKSKVSEWASKLADGIKWVVDNSDDLIEKAKILGGTLFILQGISLGAQAAMGALAGAQAIATAAQWLWNAAMNANPIGLIIAAVAALIGLVVAVVKHWETWGAAVAVFMGPLGLVISMIQSFREHWDSVVTAFKDGGILQGIKRIGFVIIDALVAPFQTLLKYISKVPGFSKIATGAAKMLQDLRTGLDNATKIPPIIKTEVAQAATPLPPISGREEPARAINPEVLKTEWQTNQIMEFMKRSEVDITVRGNTQNTEVKSRGIQPKIEPSFLY